jgi:hypothetical protein
VVTKINNRKLATKNLRNNEKLTIMKNGFLIKMVMLAVFLIYSNPSRAQLDSRLLGTLNHNFVQGVARYFKVNFGGDLKNCLIFSYLHVGKTGYYIGIGGMWIGPHYWSTLSGKSKNVIFIVPN